MKTKKYAMMQTLFVIGVAVLVWLLLLVIFGLKLDVFGTYVALFSVTISAISQIWVLRKILLDTSVNFSYKLALETTTIIYILIQGIFLFFYIRFVFVNQVENQSSWLLEFSNIYWWLVLAVTLLYGVVIYTLSRMGYFVHREEIAEKRVHYSTAQFQMEINALADRCKTLASFLSDSDKTALLDLVDKLINKGRSMRNIGTQPELLPMEEAIIEKITEAKIIAEKQENSEEVTPLLKHIFSNLAQYSAMQIK